MSVVPLSQLRVGQGGTVDDLVGENLLSHRLMEMGVTPGCAIRIIRAAPLGDPIDILIRGYHLSVRRQEAEIIRVRVMEEKG